MTVPLADLFHAGTALPCPPHGRVLLDAAEWQALLAALAAAPTTRVRALWADAAQVHMALALPGAPVVSTAIADAGYQAPSAVRPMLAWQERMIADLWGHAARGGAGCPSGPDHGLWPLRPPLAADPQPTPRTPPSGPFPDADETDTPFLGRGPVGDVIGQAAHLRLHLSGTAIARATPRLGYVHRGLIALMRGTSARAAARFAARLAGDSTVAHSLAFARAVEAAAGIAAPPRAEALRAIMAAMERLSGALGILAGLARALAADRVAASCEAGLEILARAADAAFGHRMMMDVVVPGGVALDLAPEQATALNEALARLESQLAPLRPADGPLAELAAALPASVPRAAHPGRRMASVVAGWQAAREMLGQMPGGPINVPVPLESGEALGEAEGPRGHVLHWLRMEGGILAALFPHDPAWSEWPALDAALTGTPVAEHDIILAALAPSAPGIDL
jgi:Ni,Fe-hydrogenase III large subunit